MEQYSDLIYDYQCYDGGFVFRFSKEDMERAMIEVGSPAFAGNYLRALVVAIDRCAFDYGRDGYVRHETYEIPERGRIERG